MATKSQPESLVENFNFALFGAGTKQPFRGYISAIDPTTVGPGVLIGGSVNTFKALSGGIYNRSGLKRRGPADDTQAGVVRSYEWETSLGSTRVLRADNGTLQVEFDPGTGIQYLTILSGLTEAQMNFSFAPWYSQALGKDLLIFVNGQQLMYMWPGGIAQILSASNATGIIEGILNPNNIIGANVGIFSSGGTGYAVGDLLTVSGGNGDAVIEVDTLLPGGAQAVSVAAAGSTYAVGDLVSVGGGTTKALLEVTSIGGGGAVTGLQIVAAGIGNSLTSGAPTTNIRTAGAATGLTVNISAVGNTIGSWHFTNNGSGYALSTDSAPSALTGGTGTLASIWIEFIAQGRVTIGGTTTLMSLGFAGLLTPTDGGNKIVGGTFIANGVTYTYAALGDNGFSFIGVTPDPTSLVGAVAIATVTITDTSATSIDNPQTLGGITYFQSRLEENFFNDAVTTINNQLYLMCSASRLVHVSSDLNYTHFDVDYLATGVLRTPGFPDLLTLDTNSRAASARDGDAVVFGSKGDSYLITRVASIYNQDDTDGNSVALAYEQVTVSKQISSDLSSPIDQNFVSSLNDSIIFLDDNNQLRQFGTLRNLSTPVYPFFSLDVYTELARGDFSGGMLRVVGEQSGESVYITSPKTGKVYIYQIRFQITETGDMGAERLWQPPFVVGASCVAVIDGITYVYSNTNPQMYQLWDTGQYYDDGPVDGDQLPYACHALLSYFFLNKTQQMNFDKLYFEGYMTRGSIVNSDTYLEYQGAKGIQTRIINNPVAPNIKLAKFYGAADCPVPGESIVGDIEIGDGILPPLTTDTPLPKFRAMRRVKSVDVFEAAIDVWSVDVDSQWGLLLVGANLQSTTRQPTEIMGLDGLLA